MSRSKESRTERDDLTTSGVDAKNTSAEPATANINERLGARGQTDYTPGRESMREFPRRSTSMSERGESYTQDRGPYARRSQYERTGRYEYGAGRGHEGSSQYRGRSQSSGARGSWRDADTDIYSRGEEGRYGQRSRFDRGSSRSPYDHFGRAGREPYRRFEGRGEETGRYGSGSHGFSQGFGYGRRGQEQPYDRDSTERENWSHEDRGHRFEREQYDDPYARRSYSGRFDDYETSFDPTRSSYTDYDRSERDYDREGSREWGGAHYGRNYLRCSDIMTKDVTCCSPQTSLREVADMMEDDNVGSLPVLDKGRVIGIITDRDIVCRVLAEGRDTRSAVAADAMSEDIVTCTPDEPVTDAIRKMGEHQIRRIPVCDMNGRLRGIIALADVALEAERDRDLAQALEQISQPTPNRARHM